MKEILIEFYKIMLKNIGFILLSNTSNYPNYLFI